MPKLGPTETEIEALADAMCMIMNDLADDNHVGEYVKAKARLAFEPFELDDNGDLPDIDVARMIVAAKEGGDV